VETWRGELPHGLLAEVMMVEWSRTTGSGGMVGWWYFGRFAEWVVLRSFVAGLGVGAWRISMGLPALGLL
jgi:hypothetical protein